MMVLMLLLQKYRIFLKRMTEAISSDGRSSHGKNLIEKTLRSSFATGHPSLMISALQQELLGNIGLPPSFGATIFSTQQSSSSNPRAELGYGQSHLGKNSACLQQPTFGNNSFYQSHREKLYEQETQARPSKNNFPTGGILGSNNIHDIRNKGSSSGSGWIPDLSSNYSIADQLGRKNQLSPRFSNVNQHGNNPILLSQQNNSWNGRLFDHPTNDNVPKENMFPPQFAKSDVYDIFLNQQKNPSYTEVRT